MVKLDKCVEGTAKLRLPKQGRYRKPVQETEKCFGTCKQVSLWADEKK
jgi:hypothetical protein